MHFTPGILDWVANKWMIYTWRDGIFWGNMIRFIELTPPNSMKNKSINKFIESFWLILFFGSRVIALHVVDSNDLKN